MNTRNFTTAFTVNQTPEAAFAAITNVRGWWSEDIEGGTTKLGDEFIFYHEDIHRSKQKITTLVPNEKIAWHVLEGYLKFTKDKTEWTGTDIVFDVSKRGNKTQIHFTHQGLVPESECFDACSGGWEFYINGSLQDLIATGKGRPDFGRAASKSDMAPAL